MYIDDGAMAHLGKKKMCGTINRVFIFYIWVLFSNSSPYIIKLVTNLLIGLLGAMPISDVVGDEKNLNKT